MEGVGGVAGGEGVGDGVDARMLGLATGGVELNGFEMFGKGLGEGAADVGVRVVVEAAEAAKKRGKVGLPSGSCNTRRKV